MVSIHQNSGDVTTSSHIIGGDINNDNTTCIDKIKQKTTICLVHEH